MSDQGINKSETNTDCLRATVNVIAKKKVISLGRKAPVFEKAQKIRILS
jgi:hypothetical protein